MANRIVLFFPGLGRLAANTMKTWIVVPLLILAGGLTGCTNFTPWKTVPGSGTVITEAREVRGFDRVSVSGAGELQVTQGDEESLSIETDDNLLPFIRAEVQNGHLWIGPENVNLRPTAGIRYSLKLRNLTELNLSGSVRAETAALKTERLELRISGSGKASVARLEAGTLSAHISGSGTISTAGKVDTQEIRISGSGNARASGLESSRADVHISGSGDASLWVTEALSAHISGSGRVEYRGNPSVESHVSGSGKVHHVAQAQQR